MSHRRRYLLGAGAATLVLVLTAVMWSVLRSSQSTSVSSSPAVTHSWFVERASAAGLRFQHVNGMTGAMYLPEIMGPGVGLIDFDNDGDLDVFLPQGRRLGIHDAARPSENAMGRLFRNEFIKQGEGAGVLQFTDVTESSGIRAAGYGMGVAVGDVDNDGWVDLYLTAFGANQLYMNNRDGTFRDVSKRSGTDHSGWSVSAAFVDYDRDGALDLFVGNYLNYRVEANIPCRSLAGIADYCAPFVYAAQPSRLFRNEGHGSFADMSVASGIAREFGPALGVSTADFDGDGWVDIYVANDLQANQLWINQRDGRFKNTALAAGVALGWNGEPKSSMGIDAGDFDNDGDEDIFITELTGQGADLYVNDGHGVFLDQSAASGLRIATLPLTGFGTAWLDVDNDAWLDLLTVNGTVTRSDAQASGDDPFPFGQIKTLHRNTRDGTFQNATGLAGPAFMRPAVGRGAAFGDLDNDGDTDVVVTNTNGPAELLINEVGSLNHWVGVRAVTGQQPRDALGARVGVVREDGSVIWRRARSDGSYASANDPRVVLGQGDQTRTRVRIRVIWPDGRAEEWADVPTGRYTTINQGSGKSLP
jgi:hypothetical protein